MPCPHPFDLWGTASYQIPFHNPLGNKPRRHEGHKEEEEEDKGGSQPRFRISQLRHKAKSYRCRAPTPLMVGAQHQSVAAQSEIIQTPCPYPFDLWGTASYQIPFHNPLGNKPRRHEGHKEEEEEDKGGSQP
ncbi:hypothetical protein, partial [Microseira wollei]|uniref:hypothetical protein n=1 Tax=Microseira wollei TaxID=467598 RepID=UPI001CFE1374